MRLIVGISGATGVIYGVRLLEVLKELGIESHLVMTPAAAMTLRLETEYTMEQVEALATHTYSYRDVGASIASGSFRTDGMIVIPCSIKTLSGIAHSYADNLLVRAADVTLKEHRRLVLVVRETPLHVGHLKLMMRTANMGAVILPPVPAFYIGPKTINDLVDYTVGRVLDQFGIDSGIRRWRGMANELERKLADRPEDH